MSLRDFRDSIIEALEDSKKYPGLLVENEGLRAEIESLTNRLKLGAGKWKVYEETNRKACARIDHLEAQNRALAKGWDDIAGQLNQALRKLADLRLSLVKVLHPMCFSCEHWESPAEWARRNPDEFDESPENGMCHENPRGDPSPASDWCSKHKPR